METIKFQINIQTRGNTCGAFETDSPQYYIDKHQGDALELVGPRRIPLSSFRLVKFDCDQWQLGIEFTAEFEDNFKLDHIMSQSESEDQDVAIEEFRVQLESDLESDLNGNNKYDIPGIDLPYLGGCEVNVERVYDTKDFYVRVEFGGTAWVCDGADEDFSSSINFQAYDDIERTFEDISYLEENNPAEIIKDSTNFDVESRDEDGNVYIYGHIDLTVKVNLAWAKAEGLETEEGIKVDLSKAIVDCLENSSYLNSDINDMGGSEPHIDLIGTDPDFQKLAESKSLEEKLEKAEKTRLIVSWGAGYQPKRPEVWTLREIIEAETYDLDDEFMTELDRLKVGNTANYHDPSGHVSFERIS